MATRQIAQGLASLGRNGDTMLMHVQPHEVAGLQALANANGTSLTINPDTGLPEAFSLGGFFKSILPTVFGGAVGAAGGPLALGLAAGAATGALTNKKNPLMGALMGGLGGYGGFGLGQALGGMGGAEAAVAAQNPEGFANAAANNAGMVGGADTFVNPEAFTNASNINAMNMAGQTGGLPVPAQQAAAQWGINQDPLMMESIADSLKTAGGNAGDILTGQPGAWESFKSAPTWGSTPLTDTQAAMKIGMPIAGAALGGIEPSDLGYGGINQEEIAEQSGSKYDPYARLNLGGPSSQGESGLRLLASGGVARYDDGGMTEDNKLGAQELGVGELMPVGIASLPQAQAPEIETKLPANQPSQVNIDIMQMKEPQPGVMQQAQEGTPIPDLLRQQGGQGLNYQNMFGGQGAGVGSQGVPFGGMQAPRGYGPSGQPFASGGPVSFASGALVGGGGLYTSPQQEAAARRAAQDAAIKAEAEKTRVATNPWGGVFGTGASGIGSGVTTIGRSATPAAAEEGPPVMGLFATRAQEQQAQADYNNRLAAAKQAEMARQRRFGIGSGFNPFTGQPVYGILNPKPANPWGNVIGKPKPKDTGPKFSYRAQSALQGGANFGGRGLRLAEGGTISTGGVMDLYGASDAQDGPPLSQNGYGIGRLNALASAQSSANAETGQFASGGAPMLEDGGFVVPADVVFYAGGHSTMEGQKKFADKYGGVPIKGPGNGLSDDIPTSIEGKQPARVADGEVYIPKRNVEAAGGPKKFYKMMDKVRKQAHGSKKQAKPAKV